jgi:hypothetical protein
MKAIMVLFLPAQNGTTAPERNLSVQPIFRLAASGTSFRETSTPPFWTWFVENRRPLQDPALENDPALNRPGFDLAV